MSNEFLSLLDERGYLVADGAMGTSLFNRGLETGDVEAGDTFSARDL